MGAHQTKNALLVLIHLSKKNYQKRVLFICHLAKDDTYVNIPLKEAPFLKYQHKDSVEFHYRPFHESINSIISIL